MDNLQLSSQSSIYLNQWLFKIRKYNWSVICKPIIDKELEDLSLLYYFTSPIDRASKKQLLAHQNII